VRIERLEDEVSRLLPHRQPGVAGFGNGAEVQTHTANREPIPGYRVYECLGTGGCGEVWKAEAPGGLTKAIKFVYGYHSDKRAAIELKALERIRDVRHPFLLSLERIEIVDGQLVIVTELADGSLRERFNDCRRTGLPGIPRAELLRYLRDIADALDFMSDQHSLQHLDVKPENLLLLSGRIKVADFGLVKNYRHVTASLMGGLTPLYAAPEVFHGAPSKCSDQYSLAVVYQELLTGLLPFQANSPAELTLLHINEMPDLSSLPETDRPAIARALAKDPSKRFANCGEMVESLVLAGTGAASAGAVAAAAYPSVVAPPEPLDASSATQPPVYKTLVCDHDTPPLGTVAAQGVSLQLPPLPAPIVRDLGRVEPDSVERPMGPTLILGIGGTAGYVLRHLRRRFHERHGNIEEVPSLSMLLLDTNAQSLAAATHGEDSSSLNSQETIELPLRRPQQYRAESAKFLRWLSRRWLYNIPRSLKTEGLRPLGRLAFADHSKEVLSRLRQTVSTMADEKSITASERHTKLKFCSDSLRVYLVASISGGTGGGMAIDLAYAVQAVRDQLGLNDAGVLGILMHFTSSNPRHREVGLINAFSWLCEYQHFGRPGGTYPGDPSCGLVGFEVGRKPFRHAYLTHIGDGLGEEDLMQATGAVADYIYLDLFTPAGRYLEACRKSPCEVAPIVSQQAPLRTFGLSRTSVVQHDIVNDAITTLARDAVLGWLGQITQSDGAGQIGPAHFGIHREAAGHAASDRATHADPKRGIDAPLSLDSFIQHAQKLITSELGSDAQEFFKSLLAQAAAEQNSTWRDVIRTVDRVLGVAAEIRDYKESPGVLMSRPVRAIVQPAAAKLASDVQRLIMRFLDDPKLRLPGAKQTLKAARERVQAIEQEAGRLLVSAREKRLNVVDSARLNGEAAGAKLGAKNSEPLLQYFLRARDECVLNLVGALGRALSAELSLVLEQLVQLGRELEQVISALAKRNDENALLPGDSSFNIRSLVADGWRNRRAELAGTVQQRIKDEFVDPAGGLHEVLAKGRSQELVKRLCHTARQVAMEAVQSVDLMSFVLPAAEAGDECSGRLRTAAEAATPRLLANGGVKHLVAVLPAGSDAQRHVDKIRGTLDPDASVLVCPENEFTMCYEVSGLSLAHVAVNLIQSRHDYVELSQRVHTRHDIEWSLLTGLMSFASASVNAVPRSSDRTGPAGSAWTSGPEQADTPDFSANVL
jgi:hypothetical protein